MKSITLSFGLIILVTASAVVLAHEGHKHTKPATTPVKPRPAATADVQAADVQKVRLSGELVDPQCWFTHNGEGPSHAECAVMCARGGQDLAFLDAQSGALYTLIAVGHGKNPNDGLYDHVGHRVSIRGTVFRRGSNRGLIVEAVEKRR